MENTALYASFLGFILIFLSFRVIKTRRKLRVSIGEGGNELLQRMIRAHANFIEYTPFSLILLASIEINSFLPVWCVHFLGVLLVSGRIMHAHGMSNSVKPYRVRGMQLTFTVILFTCLANIIGVVASLLSS